MGNKSMSYRKGFRFREDQSEYVFQLKKKYWKYLWWLLLLPLLLLLFVRCEKDIHVNTVDSVTKDPVSDVHVTLDYTAYYLYNNGEFFYREKVSRELQTDGLGKGVFEDLPCSVFSYIFHAREKAIYTALASCTTLVPDPERSNFHYKRKKRLNMALKVVDLGLSVVDRETGEPLAGALVEYEYALSGKGILDSLVTAPDGRCFLEGVPQCGTIKVRRASCYGYADTTDVKISVKAAIANPDSAKIRLTPLKESFTYFVKNKYTKQPIPGATAVVILTSGNGQVGRSQSVTNVDGKGTGGYQGAFVLATVDIHASKIHYKDGKLDKNYTVEEFVKLPDEQRTIYLEPEPYLEEFRNLDSLSKEPIPGVQNDITISGIDGKTSQTREISNRNGVFYVKAMEGDKIEIYSDYSPYYHPKKTRIDSFYRGETILMEPVLVDLTFTTRDAMTDELLPDCSLAISTTISKVTSPTNSGKGAFVVKGLRLAEEISITASKPGYSTNSTKVNRVSVLHLSQASQDERDIPLTPELPPCNSGGDAKDQANKARSVKSFNMGKNSGVFKFSWDNGGSICDQILVYNCTEDQISSNLPIFDTGYTAGNGTRHLRFDNGPVITVVALSNPDNGTYWNYSVDCPK